MPSWYLGKIQYQQEQENGSLKSINEAYLLDAVSYTDAEARLYGVVADNTPDFQITSLTRMKLSDVFHFEESGEHWFKVKTNYTSIDDIKGVEKKIVCNMLVNADSPKQAIERVEKSLATMLVPYEITDVNLTPILEVYPYEAPEGFRPLSKAMAEKQEFSIPATDTGMFTSQVATGLPASTSLDGCPFHYCDSRPVCANKCRYNHNEEG